MHPGGRFATAERIRTKVSLPERQCFFESQRLFESRKETRFDPRDTGAAAVHMRASPTPQTPSTALSPVGKLELRTISALSLANDVH